MAINLLQKLNTVINNIFQIIEKNRFNIVTGSLFLIVIVLIRGYFEMDLLNKNPLTGEIFVGSLYYLYHVTAFYFTVFLAGVLIISFFSKEKPRKVANIVLLMFWVIVPAPIIDHFIFGRQIPYRYILPEKFVENLLTFLLGSRIPPGLLMQLYAIIFLGAFYVLIKSLKTVKPMRIWKRIGGASIRAGLTTISLLFVITTLTTLPLLIVNALEQVGYPYEQFGSQHHIFLFIFFLLLAIVLAAILVDMSNKKILPLLLKNLRVFRTLHFALMGIIGIIAAGSLIFFQNISKGTIYIDDLPFIILCLLVPPLLYQFAGLINDIYDIEIDKTVRKKSALITGILTKSQYLHLAILVAVISFVISILLGHIPMLLTLIYIFFAYAYSVPPLRLRNSLFSSSIIGLWSVLAFLMGYFTTNHVEPVFIGNYEFWVPFTTVNLTSNAIVIALMIFFALSMGPILTDLKDYEGDKKAGVKSVYTVYGLDKGKKIATALIPVMFLIPLFLFHNIQDIIVLIAFGVLTMIDFRKFGDARHVFGYYFVVLIYCMVRWAGMV